MLYSRVPLRLTGVASLLLRWWTLPCVRRTPRTLPSGACAEPLSINVGVIVGPTVGGAALLLVLCSGAAAFIATRAARRRWHDSLVARAVTIGELRTSMSSASSEIAVQKVALAAVRTIYPTCTAAGIVFFGEEGGTERVALVEVVADGAPQRRALLKQLGSTDIGARRRATAGPGLETAVAAACYAQEALDSRDVPGGMSAFVDWAAASAAGCGAGVAATIPITAGPLVLATLTVHFQQAPPDNPGTVLQEACHAIGAELFLRRMLWGVNFSDAQPGRPKVGSTTSERRTGTGPPDVSFTFSRTESSSSSALSSARQTDRGRSGDVPGGSSVGGANCPLHSPDCSRELATHSRGPPLGAGESSVHASVTSVPAGSDGPAWAGGTLASAASLRRRARSQISTALTLEELGRLDDEADASSAELSRWDLDAWQLSDERLLRLLLHMFHSLNLLRTFSITPATLLAFLEKAADRYHANPFHNWRHVRRFSRHYPTPFPPCSLSRTSSLHEQSRKRLGQESTLTFRLPHPMLPLQAWTVAHTSWRFLTMSESLRQKKLMPLDHLVSRRPLLPFLRQHPSTDTFRLS